MFPSIDARARNNVFINSSSSNNSNQRKKIYIKTRFRADIDTASLTKPSALYGLSSFISLSYSSSSSHIESSSSSTFPPGNWNCFSTFHQYQLELRISPLETGIVFPLCTRTKLERIVPYVTQSPFNRPLCYRRGRFVCH